MATDHAFRVLQLHNRQTPGAGADNVVDDEAEMLSGAGHFVEQMFVDRLVDDPDLTPVSAAAKAIWNRQAGRRLRQLIVDFAPDVVHVHDPFAVMSPVVFRVASSLNTPAVATLHNYRYTCVKGTLYRDGHVCTDCVGPALKYPAVVHGCYRSGHLAAIPLTVSLGIHRLAKTFDSIKYFIVPSLFVRSVMISDGFDADQIIVKPNFVADPGYNEVGSGADYFVFGGRLVYEKGIRTVLEAWQMMESPPRLIVAGDGGMRGEVEEAARRSDFIEYRGWVDRSDMTNLLKGAIGTVFSSMSYEAGPLAILESFAAGTAVFASDLGNFSDVIDDGKTGWLFSTGDPVDLRHVVENAMSDPARLRQMGKNARVEYEGKYTPASNLAALTSIYERVRRY